jgi:hypothetical protein
MAKRQGRARVGRKPQRDYSYSSQPHGHNARSEAKEFLRWVRLKVLTVEQARAHLKITAEQRAALERVCSRLVASQSVGFRNRVLLHFDHMLSDNSTVSPRRRTR